MPRYFFSLPSVDPEVDVRLDTDADTVSPAVVHGMGGAGPIPGAKLNAAADGSLPRVTTTDGTATLFVKMLDYTGAQIGDPVEVAGIDEDATPDTPNAPSVAVFNIVTGSFATADLASGAYAEFAAEDIGDASAGWDLTDPTRLLPPQPGLYAVSLKAYASGTLDEPAELSVQKLGGGENGVQAAVAGVPAGATDVYAASASRLIAINDAATEGIRVQGGYSNNAPTTGGVDLRMWVHRVGDLPA